MKQVYTILLCSCVSLVAFADLPKELDPAKNMHKAAAGATQGVFDKTNCDTCPDWSSPVKSPKDEVKIPEGTGIGTEVPTKKPSNEKGTD